MAFLVSYDNSQQLRMNWYTYGLGTINTMHDTTEQLLEIKDRMPTEHIHCAFENHAREAHHLTMQNLKCIESVRMSYFDRL